MLLRTLGIFGRAQQTGWEVCVWVVGETKRWVWWWFELGLVKKKKEVEDGTNTLVPPWLACWRLWKEKEREREVLEKVKEFFTTTRSLGFFLSVVSLPAGSHEAATMHAGDVATRAYSV